MEAEMSTRKSNVRRLKTQLKLTSEEIKRIAEKLAVRMEHDAEEVGLLLLFVSHLEMLAEHKDSYLNLWSALYDFRKHLFIGCPAADSAQDQFQSETYAKRGKLLLWPYEREGVVK
jgi:hypothetical protein